MHKVILHIGSNIGNREKYLAVSKRLIKERIGKIEKASKIYETEAWGIREQGPFLNQALMLNTNLDAHNLLKHCQDIENLLGRERSIRWGPRTLDIDIIFYDSSIFHSNDLSIPHPRMHERNFVLVPVNEIAPHWEHPIYMQTVNQLLEKSKDETHVSI